LAAPLAVRQHDQSNRGLSQCFFCPLERAAGRSRSSQWRRIDSRELSTLSNSIVAHNGTGRDNCRFTEKLQLWDANIATDLTCGDSTMIRITDPLLGSLRDNGGPSLTHAVGFDSPAFNGAGGPCATAVDQRYQPRDAACDIGAYESTERLMVSLAIDRIGTLNPTGSVAVISGMTRFTPELIAIGNGTASRETETLVRDTLREHSLTTPQVVVVSEAGASVYSASDVAREELPDLDVSLRGAVSIARRLQDPLAELVKIDPKAIGVGQYQHDVNQTRLKQRLDEIVEICVNRVGVEVNTASVSLLSYVAGVGPTLAANIVKTRDTLGGFRSRKDLTDVPRLGAKAFEQAAGFLRVRGGVHPLDATAVHPERYPLVERIARDLEVPLGSLLQNEAAVERIDVARYVADGVGLPTLQDILSELRRPGRDPREQFEPPAFRDDVTDPKHLTEGMVLEGVVTNIVAFGAFVDIGVHQDGLVHVSQLADRFVRDPNDVVKVGQKVKVTVVSVDLERNRIALTMRTAGAAEGRGKLERRTLGIAGRPGRGRRQRLQRHRSQARSRLTGCAFGERRDSHT
jgi:transcriptional accessory protein Tex/SPT6